VEARVARDTGLYRTDSTVKDGQHDVQYSMGSFTALVKTTWLVTSEGAIVRKSAADYQESFAVGTQAADGMSLERSYATTGNALKDLDSPEAFANMRSHSSPRSPICARRRWSRKSITGPC